MARNLYGLCEQADLVEVLPNDLVGTDDDGSPVIYCYCELECSECERPIGWWDDGFTGYYADDTQKVNVCEDCYRAYGDAPCKGCVFDDHGGEFGAVWIHCEYGCDWGNI